MIGADTAAAAAAAGAADTTAAAVFDAPAPPLPRMEP